MALKEQVKEQIDEIRGGRTYLDLHKLSGLDPGYAHRLTTKPLNLTLDTLEKVADALDCDVEVKLVHRTSEK